MKLEKLIEKLNEVIPANCRALVGGSWALNHVYGVLHRRADDVDIIITSCIFNPEERTKLSQDCLEAIQSLFPVEELSFCGGAYAGNKGKDTLINHKIKTHVNYGSRTLNFIMSSQGSYADHFSAIKMGNMPVVPLMEIIKAKIDYNREKDQADFFNIIKNISSGANPYDLPF